MDPSRLQILVTVAFPGIFGAILIMISIVGCRLHTHHQRLSRLEADRRVSTVSLAPPASPAPPAPPAPLTASPILDPIPPPPDHYVLSMPTVAAVAQMRHYNGYI